MAPHAGDGLTPEVILDPVFAALPRRVTLLRHVRCHMRIIGELAIPKGTP